MKKIIKYILLVVLFVFPFVSHAATCTGDLRTDLTAAQQCANLAESQGSNLGYTIDCKVDQLGLGGFTDPTSGKDYILNTACSVNGSAYEYGAYLLAGFTAASTSNAIVSNVNPGWDTLKTELQYENAFNQCGGQAPYYINGAYTCTAPAGTQTATPPTSSTKIISSSVDPVLANQKMYNSIFSINKQLVSNILDGYTAAAKTMLTSTATATTTKSQCYVFNKNLQTGDSGPDVLALTYVLKKEGFISMNKDLFTTEVAGAVKKFQEAHASAILTPIGLTQGTGFVGTRTRDYLNINCLAPTTITKDISLPPPPPPSSNTCATTASVSNQKTGVYKYTFTKNTDATYKVQLNNPAYGVVGDKYYVAANFSFNAPNALDLNRQNQGWFNYLSSLPGTAEGNTFYQNMFGSFNNAYYDWDNMTSQLNAKIATCATTTPSTTTPPPATTAPLSQTGIRYIKVSVADWDTLPLALREVTILGPNNTIIKPKTVSATDFNVLAYTTPANLSDGNENTLWMANKTSGEDLQVVTFDLGQTMSVEKVKIMNYGLTDTRVFVVEVSANDSSYQKIAEVRAQINTPIADKGIVWGIVSAAGTMGPIQY